MGEREERRKRSARVSQVSEAPAPPPPPVVIVPTWECSKCHVRATRGEACSKCGKRLLEG